MLKYAYLAAGIVGILMVVNFLRQFFTDHPEVEDDDFIKWI